MGTFCEQRVETTVYLLSGHLNQDMQLDVLIQNSVLFCEICVRANMLVSH